MCGYKLYVYYVLHVVMTTMATHNTVVRCSGDYNDICSCSGDYHDICSCSDDYHVPYVLYYMYYMYVTTCNEDYSVAATMRSTV